MTKEMYLEMCSQLGSDPLESEIPVELGDMPIEVEQAFHVYNLLPSNIDWFNGNYFGKELSQAPQIMHVMGFDTLTQRELLKILIIINALDQEEVNRKKKNGR